MNKTTEVPVWIKLEPRKFRNIFYFLSLEPFDLSKFFNGPLNFERSRVTCMRRGRHTHDKHKFTLPGYYRLTNAWTRKAMTPSVVGMGGMKICKETQINTNENMWLDQESNPRPLHHLSGALPLSYTFHLAQTTTSHWPKFYKANWVSLCVVELYSTQVLYILFFKNQTKKNNYH